jgi:hypothetical protein
MGVIMQTKIYIKRIFLGLLVTSCSTMWSSNQIQQNKNTLTEIIAYIEQIKPIATLHKYLEDDKKQQKDAPFNSFNSFTTHYAELEKKLAPVKNLSPLPTQIRNTINSMTPLTMLSSIIKQYLDIQNQIKTINKENIFDLYQLKTTIESINQNIQNNIHNNYILKYILTELFFSQHQDKDILEEIDTLITHYDPELLYTMWLSLSAENSKNTPLNSPAIGYALPRILENIIICSIHSTPINTNTFVQINHQTLSQQNRLLNEWIMLFENKVTVTQELTQNNNIITQQNIEFHKRSWLDIFKDFESQFNYYPKKLVQIIDSQFKTLNLLTNQQREELLLIPHETTDIATLQKTLKNSEQITVQTPNTPVPQPHKPDTTITINTLQSHTFNKPPTPSLISIIKKLYTTYPILCAIGTTIIIGSIGYFFIHHYFLAPIPVSNTPIKPIFYTQPSLPALQ